MLAHPKAPQTARRALRFSPIFKSCRHPQQCVLSRRSPVQIAGAEKKFKPGAFCQSNRELQIGWVPCDADSLPIHDQLQRELAKENPLLQILLLRQTIDHNQKGVVTLSNCSRVNLAGKFGSSRGRHSLPGTHCLVAKLAKYLAGNQMALDVEDIVDGGVGGEKSLR